MIKNTALEEYLTWKAANRPKTAKIYRRLLSQFCDFCSKGEIGDYKIEDVSHFQLELEKRYSSKTVCLYTTAIRDFFRYFSYLEETHIGPNMIPNIRVEEHHHKTLTHNEFLKIDEKITDLKKKALHHFLWDSALRISEVLNLKVSEISLDDKSAYVRIGKSRQMGWVFWSDKTNDVLREYIKENKPTLNLFPFDRRTAERYIREMSKNAGIPKIVPHSYRHGQAHYIVEKGGGLIEVSSKLHHVALESSRIYLQFNKEEQRKLSEKFF